MKMGVGGPWEGARRSAGACALAGLLAACSSLPFEGRAGATLYERLGSAPRVQAVVDRAVARAATDPRTRRSFDGVNLRHLKGSISAHLCVVADGLQCGYEGLSDMAKAHGDLRITPSEFDAFVGILREELDRAGVADAAKNELLRRLAPQKRVIVGA